MSKKKQPQNSIDDGPDMDGEQDQVIVVLLDDGDETYSNDEIDDAIDSLDGRLDAQRALVRSIGEELQQLKMSAQAADLRLAKTMNDLVVALREYVAFRIDAQRDALLQTQENLYEALERIAELEMSRWEKIKRWFAGNIPW